MNFMYRELLLKHKTIIQFSFSRRYDAAHNVIHNLIDFDQNQQRGQTPILLFEFSHCKSNANALPCKVMHMEMSRVAIETLVGW